MRWQKRDPRTGEMRISYIRRPLARRSKMACLLTAASLALMVICIRTAVRTAGQAGLNAGAMGFCSFLLAVVALCYSGFSFLEADRNYLLAKIMLVISGILVLAWLAVIVVGLVGG